MIVLAAVLLVLIAIVAIVVLSSGGEPIALGLPFGAELQTNLAVVFVTALVLGAVIVVALGLLRIGLRRDLRHRREVNELKRRAGEKDDPELEEGQPSDSAQAAETSRRRDTDKHS
ncbi:MAG TPA: hypothetical protein VK053_02870 [Jiangellaceae bacterium]|nr:hypothetical protein [Jiangellaceae bacterium]